MKYFSWLLALACLPTALGAFLTLPAAAQTPDSAALLTLSEAVRIAVAQNYNILIARNEAEIARNNHSLGNAGFLPVVGLTARQSRSTPSNFGGSQNGFGSGNTFDLAAGASVNVFDGFGRVATYNRLQALSEQGVLSAQRTAEESLADVIILYYDLARQQQQIDVLKDNIGISEERVRIAELRRDLGSASELELRQARVDLNSDRAALLRQEISLSNTKATLNQMLGREDSQNFRVVDEIDVDPNILLPPLQAEAAERNRSLLVAERSRQAAEWTRREVRSDWLPSLDLQVGYAFNDLTSDLGLPTTRRGGFTYGLTAGFNLFEGFNRNRRLENAQLQIRNSELRIEEIRTRVETDLENAYKNYQNSLALVALESENRDLAEQNVEVALERFRLGTITSIELRDVQTTLANIGARLTTARFEAKRAETDLLQLSGRLLDATASL